MTKLMMWGILLAILMVTGAASQLLAADAGRYFKIQVIDDQTKRGVPLVELRTVNNVRYYTDSAGLVAFYEPGLMGQSVFFFVESRGYEYPKDGFGNRGLALEVKEGGSAEIKVRRTQIAERLYRVTGEGIYRDSVLLGIVHRSRSRSELQGKRRCIVNLNGAMNRIEAAKDVTYDERSGLFWNSLDQNYGMLVAD
jgi:hypothetical protein